MTLGSLYNDSGSDYENYQRRLSSDLFKVNSLQSRNNYLILIAQYTCEPHETKMSLLLGWEVLST